VQAIVNTERERRGSECELVNGRILTLPCPSEGQTLLVSMSGKETGLEPFVDQPISVITNDGRNIVGILKGFDQATNLILDESHERVYSTTVSHALRQLQIVLWGKITGMKEMQRFIALVIKDLLKASVVDCQYLLYSIQVY
jgi:small nuclear ribonucleoprotein (snRNP)-like protein